MILKCILNFLGLRVSYFYSLNKNLSIGVIYIEIHGIISCQLSIEIWILEKTSVAPIENLKMNHRVFGTNRELLILRSMFKNVSSFQNKKLKLNCLKIFVCYKNNNRTLPVLYGRFIWLPIKPKTIALAVDRQCCQWRHIGAFTKASVAILQ